jgi:3-phenylpropionate/cinnamic acid dioxygenase small subunit
VTEYEDKAAIIETINLYAFALDAHQWDLFDQVFTDDVKAEFGPAGVVWPDRDTVVKEFAEFHETLDTHQHTMMGHLVHLDGDTASAFTYGDWLLVRYAAEGGSTWVGRGWYDDRLVRTDRGWRISHRICRLLSYSGNPNVPQPIGTQNPDHNPHVLREHCASGQINFLNAIRGGVDVGSVVAR